MSTAIPAVMQITAANGVAYEVRATGKDDLPYELTGKRGAIFVLMRTKTPGRLSPLPGKLSYTDTSRCLGQFTDADGTLRLVKRGC